jgi:hypothetical protein
MEDEKKSKKDKKKNDAIVKNTIEINPKLEEDVSPTAVFSFGRMNPPTIGHEKLVDKINTVAKQNNAMPHLYLSQSYDSNKNPLPYATKIALAKKAFGSMVMKSRSKTLMQVAKELEDMGHTKLIMVAGSDRVAEFKTLLNKYNGKDYTFDSIEVVSAGERDPDAEGVAGMSASKMRAAAANGDEKAFKSGLPKKLQSSASKVYQAVRDGMKIAEEMEIELGEDLMFEAVLSVAARKKRAMAFKKSKAKIMRGRKIAAKKMASPEKLKLRSRKKAIEIIRKKVAGAKGLDYNDLGPSERMAIDKKVEKKKGAIAKIAKKQYQGVKKAEKERLAKVRQGPAEESVNEEFENLFEREDKDIGDREGSQPAKYHSGLAKSTKQKRDAQFSKAAEKDSDDPSAYPDKHIGDSDAKTKTSTHTKRYHQMFGKESTVKHDRRFKRYRVNMVKPVELDEKGFVEEVDYMLDDVLNEMFEEVIVEKSLEGLKKKSEKSGISYGILKKVYDRGMAAWRTGHRPGAGQEQWAYARVNSFITKGKGTWGKADADLAAKVRGEEIELGEGAVDTAKAANKKEANSWRTDGHYLENGEEWDGDQHAYEGEVYTGAEHGPDSKRLYHYKELPSSIRAKIDAALKEDNRENIQVGDFETKHFDMCPSAVALYKKLEPTDEVVKSAKLHDTLFGIEKEVIETETATQDDLDTAKKIAAQIMSMAKAMDKEEEHSYVQSHVDKIAEYVKDVKEEKEEEVDHDKCGTPDCCGQCDTATDDVNEAFNAMISDTMFQEQQVKAGFKSSDDVDESRIDFMLNKDKYKQAAKLVKKEKAKDKTGRHTTSYWAAEVIRTNSLKLDPRLLAKMVDEEYGAGEEGTDELNAKYKKDTPGQ